MHLALFLATAAYAEESKFDGTVKDGAAAEKPEAHLSAQFGGTYTAGNTSSALFNGRLDGSYKWGKNRFTLVTGANFGQGIVDANGDGHLDDAERAVGRTLTAKKLYADGRYDRFFSEKDSLYVLAGAFTDSFSGFDWRAHGQFGYSRQLVKTDELSLLGEIGADYAREDYIEGVDPNNADVFAARVFVGAHVKISENAGIDESVEAFENVVHPEDFRLANNIVLNTKISNTFSLNLGHTLLFDNQPVEGFGKADHTVLVTLVASIL